MIFDCLIVGGGASGLAAAVALGKKGMRTAILEKQARVGRKLLSTGNGRCNLSNMHARSDLYFGDFSLAQDALGRFSPNKVLEFFYQIGLPVRVDSEGRVYPMSNQASSVLDVLRLSASEYGVEVIPEFAVASLEKRGGLFEAKSSDGKKAVGRRVLVCTGGLAAPKLGACGDGYRLLSSFGHKISPRFPALTPILVSQDAVRGLKGLKIQGRIDLQINGMAVQGEDGEALFSDGCVSGIAAMQLARRAGEALAQKKRAALSISMFAPGTNCASLVRFRQGALKARATEDFLTGIVPKRIGQVLLRAAGAENQGLPAEALSESVLDRIAQLLSGWEIPITGICGFDQAQVTAGGALLCDFCLDSMESKMEKGLYAAGEVLNVDGMCGGFNLQWAWASALTAAEAMV